MKSPCKHVDQTTLISWQIDYRCTSIDCFLVFFTEFSILPSNVTATIGFPARFDCQANNGYTRWAKGSNLLMITSINCDGCQIYSNGSLAFASVNLSHRGLYVCFIIRSGTQVNPRPSINVYLTIPGQKVRCCMY